ncbi:MAG: serine/threonine-protein kinase, partial [Planctomycetota bacterium]|nr:serine/threonine-protein kinase [Planctomycetota bacterium]
MTNTHRCPRCGAELAQEVAQGLCPKCLMKAGLGSRTEAGEAETLAPPGFLVASPAQVHVPPEAGKIFGSYHLVRLLGQGGMGAVYEAEQLESGRRVALKILSQSLDSAEARARFLREGRLAASVNHPNSVYIYGTEEIEGTPAIAMELVPGGTIEDRIKQKGPMPAPEAVDAILQIIEGLEAAQAVGVLHRDVKPSNCFIENDGTVKIGDFGLSISTKGRAEPNVTVTGTFLGTPAFSSPEQLRGDELDVRSDIYAVGITLYYLLTGKTPFKADNLVRFVATVL